MLLEPLSRRPTILPAETLDIIRSASIPPCERKARPSRPHLSIVVVTWNNLVFTKLCLHTVIANTYDSSYEVIVVDNGSTDGTVEFLKSFAATHREVVLVLNTENRGFPAAVNTGIAQARGEYVVLLNNDVMVPPGWSGRLLRHLKTKSVGLVGPLTNNSGNEAEIRVRYKTYAGFVQFASLAQAQVTVDLPVATMFCVASRLDVVRQLGPLDESFEIGMFEDDDYSMRARRAGYRVVCAEDTFVHHFGQVSFGVLASNGTYGSLFHENRSRFERKWKIAWSPHARRVDSDYEALVEDVQRAGREVFPADAIVVVVSKGDDRLLDVGVKAAWHFPRSVSGEYAGFYPSSGTDAVNQLETLRTQGAEYLLIPETALWWLERFPELADWLRQRATRHATRPSCVIFALGVRGDLRGGARA